MSQEQEYVLGTDRDELERLGIQHRIWSDAAVQAWKRAAILPGDRVLDLGCGPGHATFDLAQMVGDRGAVVGADVSQRFISNLNEQAKLRHLPQVSGVIVDAENLQKTLSSQSFDAAYTRWLLCWLKSPEKAIEGVFQALKPGGRFIIHDYFNWKSFSIGPRSAAVEKMVEAAVKSFEDRDGDVDVAAKIPSILKKVGFEIYSTDVHLRVARGGGKDGTIAWPLTWWRTYGPKLVQMGYLSKEDCNDALTDMTSVETSDERFFVCPPVFEFIAVRKK